MAGFCRDGHIYDTWGCLKITTAPAFVLCCIYLSTYPLMQQGYSYIQAIEAYASLHKLKSILSQALR